MSTLISTSPEGFGWRSGHQSRFQPLRPGIDSQAEIKLKFNSGITLLRNLNKVN